MLSYTQAAGLVLGHVMLVGTLWWALRGHMTDRQLTRFILVLLAGSFLPSMYALAYGLGEDAAIVLSSVGSSVGAYYALYLNAQGR